MAICWVLLGADAKPSTQIQVICIETLLRKISESNKGKRQPNHSRSFLSINYPQVLSHFEEKELRFCTYEPDTRWLGLLTRRMHFQLCFFSIWIKWLQWGTNCTISGLKANRAAKTGSSIGGWY